jgi:hypothetical protein
MDVASVVLANIEQQFKTKQIDVDHAKGKLVGAGCSTNEAHNIVSNWTLEELDEAYELIRVRSLLEQTLREMGGITVEVGYNIFAPPLT